MAEHGGIVVDGVQGASTLQCPHCGCHFETRPGSGRRRTFCLRCMGVTCGARDCDPCIPLEARLEHQEGRKTPYDDEIGRAQGSGLILL